MNSTGLHGKFRLSRLNYTLFGKASSLLSLAAHSLKTRMAMTVVAFVVVTTFLVTSMALVLAKRGMREIISEQQFSLLAHLADEIDQKFFGRQIALQSLTVNISNNPNADPAWLQRYLEQQADLRSLFDNLLVYSANGAQLANLNESVSRDNSNFGVGRSIKDSVATRRGVISAPLRNATTQRSIVTLTMPIFNGQGEVALVLVGLVDLEQKNFLGHLAHIKMGRSGYVYVVTGDGTIVEHPKKSRALQNVAAVEGYNSALEQAFAGFEGTTEGRNRLVGNGLHTFKRLKSTKWIVAAVYPEAEAFAPIADVEQKAMLAAAFLAIFIGPLAWWIMRRQISPLQQLRDRIQAVREDPALVEVSVHYRKDEIGDLGRAFDSLLQERLAAEARYKAAAAEMRAATDSSLDAFFIFHPERDESGRIVDFRFWYLNANAERLIGMKQEEVQNERLCALLPEMRTEGLFDKFAHAVTSGLAIQEECPIQSPRIRARWLHSQAVPVGDGVAITMRDVTERKQREVEIRDNRAFLQSLIDYLPVLVFAKSFRPEQYDQIVVWNKAAETVMGYAADKVLGKCNREIFPPRVAATLNELDRQMLATPKVVIIPEYPYRRPDGVLCYLRSITVPLLGENGQLDYVLGIVEDITERRKHERELSQSERRIRMITDNLPALIAYVDNEERYRFCNNQYEQFFNARRGTVVGRTVRDVLGEKTYAIAADKIAAALAGERVKYERQFTDKGSGHHWLVDYIPDRAQDGTVAGFYVMVIDITELRLVEERLKLLEHGSAIHSR